MFGPDGSRILSGGHDDKRSLVIWDAVTGQETLSLSMINHSQVAYSPDGKRIICSGAVPTVTILDASKRQPKADAQ